MGQAKERGTYEERKAEAIAKRRELLTNNQLYTNIPHTPNLNPGTIGRNRARSMAIMLGALCYWR